MGFRLPPKLADGAKRIALVVTPKWIEKIYAWHRHDRIAEMSALTPLLAAKMG